MSSDGRWALWPMTDESFDFDFLLIIMDKKCGVCVILTCTDMQIYLVISCNSLIFFSLFFTAKWIKF